MYECLSCGHTTDWPDTAAAVCSFKRGCGFAHGQFRPVSAEDRATYYSSTRKRIKRDCKPWNEYQRAWLTFLGLMALLLTPLAALPFLRWNNATVAIWLYDVSNEWEMLMGVSVIAAPIAWGWFVLGLFYYLAERARCAGCKNLDGVKQH